MVVPGASIAIDDCYELWESGFVSIPYSFELRDLQPQLQKLLQGARAESHSTSDSEQLSNSKCDPDTDAQPAYTMGDQYKSHHSREENQKAPFMEGSASADIAGSMSANALAGAPIESPFGTFTSDCTFQASSRACSCFRSKLELNASKRALPLAESRRIMMFKIGKQELLVSRHHCYQRYLPHQANILNARLKFSML